jgi:hypothetical protein
MFKKVAFHLCKERHILQEEGWCEFAGIYREEQIAKP